MNSEDKKPLSEIAKQAMEEFVVTDEMRKEMAEWDLYLKRDLGGINVELMFNEDEKFLKKKFGKLPCSFCGHKFNPFYAKTIKEGEWKWVWRGDSHKEPESTCDVNCPKCNEALYFRIYVGQ
jgi:hypothetical protein